MATKTSMVYNVTRQAAELVPPAGPTPFEYKELSDIDTLRFHVWVIQFYKKEEGDNAVGSIFRRRDPAKVIKEAVAKALVWYYPLAGRLLEISGRKLVVDCNREGILFVEADADVTLEDFGVPPLPPFPCLEQLISNVPGSTAILGTPLILIQVTRLKCGGFILSVRLNHAMSDAGGLVQFMHAVAELARGADSPSVLPVWDRHLLNARDPPRITCDHPEYDGIPDTTRTINPRDDIVHNSFFFGPTEIAALKRFIPPHQKASTFEILTACLWRCRTISLQLDPEETVRIMCMVNSRNIFNPPLPSGYYGNAIAYSGASSSAGKISKNPIGYALDLIKKTKAKVTQEFMMSLADLMVIKGRPRFNETFVVSDITRAGFDELDYGWGPPVYGGNVIPGTYRISVYVPLKNWKGEKGIFVPICLPRKAMKIFVKELNELLRDLPEHRIASSRSSPSIFSYL
ncbi:benzyl alcohol O-benzoyltransferase-like [Spinacia oleracea]|uniref:Benzyl alcohol O-benzoyltransferase-like n=1 Tax=Spinacia oleracea TaxID=3562 RepID=A0A9R0IWB8_SPIOL|nr:benzyl alcohol O-benzoyltransferase-like [Spinacia oleracea]